MFAGRGINKKQFTPLNSKPDNHVMFTILLFIPPSIYETHLTKKLQADDWFCKRTLYR